MAENNRSDGYVALVIVLMLSFVIWLLSSSCSSHHYFSINAEEITNPNIQYHDSTAVSNPF